MPRTQAPRDEQVLGEDAKSGPERNQRADDGGTGRNGASKPSPAGPVKSSHIIEEHIDVGVPRETAYDQWTRYDDLSRYTKKESAQEKRQDRIGFTSKIGPSTRTWETQVVEQVPGRRIVWRSIGGANTMGVVTFHSIDDRLTRVMVEMEYHPSGFFETVGNFFRMQRRRVRKDLRLFKNFIELRGEATGEGSREPVRSEHGLRQETDERLDGDDEYRRGGDGTASDGRHGAGGARRAATRGTSAARKTASTAKSAARKAASKTAQKTGVK